MKATIHRIDGKPIQVRGTANLLGREREIVALAFLNPPTLCSLIGPPSRLADDSSVLVAGSGADGVLAQGGTEDSSHYLSVPGATATDEKTPVAAIVNALLVVLFGLGPISSKGIWGSGENPGEQPGVPLDSIVANRETLFDCAMATTKCISRYASLHIP